MKLILERFYINIILENIIIKIILGEGSGYMKQKKNRILIVDTKNNYLKSTKQSRTTKNYLIHKIYVNYSM